MMLIQDTELPMIELNRKYSYITQATIRNKIPTAKDIKVSERIDNEVVSISFEHDGRLILVI